MRRFPPTVLTGINVGKCGSAGNALLNTDDERDVNFNFNFDIFADFDLKIEKTEECLLLVNRLPRKTVFISTVTYIDITAALSPGLLLPAPSSDFFVSPF